MRGSGFLAFACYFACGIAGAIAACVPHGAPLPVKICAFLVAVLFSTAGFSLMDRYADSVSK